MNLLATFFELPGTGLVIAGGLGGLARWLFVILVDRRPAPKQGPAFILLGCILGYYVSPAFQGALGHFLESLGLSVEPDRVPGLAAFATGVAAIGLIAFGLDWLAQRRKKLDGDSGVDPSPKPAQGDGP